LTSVFFIVMVGTLPGPESAALHKPLVGVIGDSEDILEAIESCKDRVEFVRLGAIPEEPNFWSVRGVSGVVICGLTWLTRFHETNPSDELGIVVAVNNFDEFSAALRAGAFSVLIAPASGDELLSQIESQLHFVSGRKRSEQLLAGQREILEMISCDAEFERTIGAVAHLIEKIEPDVRCAISALTPDRAAFLNVYAPSLPRLSKVRLQQTRVGRPMLNPNRQDSNDHAAIFLADLATEHKWNDSDWAKALIADGFRCCLFIPVLHSKGQPLAVLSLFGSNAANFLTSDSQLAQTATHLIAIAFEKRAREEELRNERERLSLALDGGRVGMWNWDLITNEIAWSEQCKMFFGYSPDAKVTFEDFLAALHPKDRDRTMKAIEESIRDGIPYDIEYRVLHPDGTVRWISAIGRTFRDDFERPTRMGGVARDVTERRQFDEELQENQFQLRTALNAAELARREAETATRAKDQFLAVLSHELRTPLTPIMMAASWLRNAPELAEQARNAFDMIFRNAELEARLVDDLLDLTRIARNQLELQFRAADLHAVLRAAIEVCETGIRQKKQSLNLKLAATRTRVQCDVARIQQVFWNLLKNAIKFTPESGEIFVSSINENDNIIVEVSDSGIGIDPRIIPKIFVPFEQGDKDVVKQFGGLGLGLAISKAVVDAHGGTIAVRSEGKDLGAAFTVRLRLIGEPVIPRNVVEK
jgi:PAS domain S-box-containing protein